MTRQLQGIGRGLINTKRNGGFFPNILLFGPGGTGKTLIAEEIAENSGMTIIETSGGDFAQHIMRGNHVTEFNRLWRLCQTQPTVFFIDEAEGIAKKRSELDQPHTEIQNALLHATGSPSKSVAIIMATNRPQDFDEAMLSRCDYKIFIGPPGVDERKAIIDQYARKLLTEADVNDFFSSNALQKLAEDTTGFTGRMLFKMINAIFTRKSTTDRNELTSELIAEVVQEFIAQEKRMITYFHD